jgi:uncharacterized protein (TIGR03437 family)
MKNRILSLAAIAAVVIGATGAWTYTLQYGIDANGNGYFKHWDTGTAANPTSATVNMAMNLTFPAPSNFNDPNVVRAMFLNDMVIWNNILKSNNIRVQFADGGVNNTLKDPACDGVNLITLVSSNSVAAYTPPPGVLALSVLQAVSSPGQIDAGVCGPKAFNTTFAGQIVDADVVFNTSFSFSTDGRFVGGSATNQASDMEGTFLHELGHVLGLHHTTLDSALMIPATQQAFPIRSLSSDDIAGINAAYGVNNLGGSISGKVTDTSGNPIYGAAVQLTDTTSGLPTVSQITDQNGAFSMVGFPAGTYKVWVKPLDTPFTPVNYVGTAYASASGTGFNALAVSNPAVVTGKATLVLPTIQVIPVHTATLTSISVGTITTTTNPNGSTSTNFVSQQGVLISARRAGTPASAYPATLGNKTGTYTLCTFGGNLSGDITTSVPTAAALTSTTTTNNCGAQFGRDFNFPSNTPTGFYDVYMANDFLPSSLQITTNPFVGAGWVVDAVANTKSYAAGAFITIYGLDLGLTDTTATVFPVPTQRAGVSVRVGDRFAPLFFVAPGQINAQIPYDIPYDYSSGAAKACTTLATTGCVVDVQIVTGNNSVFDYGNITVVSSVPRIFSKDQTGAGQGIVFDGSGVGCPASCPLADASAPATAGHILVIYMSGLGQTTPAAITGLNGSGTISPLPTVSITANGQTLSAPVVYAGAVGCCAALYQVNASVPTGLGVSNTAQLVVTDSKGNKSNTITIAVK